MRYIVLSAMMLCISLFANAQATDLVIDNQTPGWLLSKINFVDQQTVKNLKVTGYINNEDLEFIGTLITTRSLNGELDLSGCNIVGQTRDNDNVLVGLGASGSLKVYRIPKSSVKVSNCIGSLYVENMYFDCKMTKVDQACLGGKNTNIGCLYLGENIDTIPDQAFCRVPGTQSNVKISSVYFPVSLKHIGSQAFAGSELSFTNFNELIYIESIGLDNYYSYDYRIFGSCSPDTLIIPSSIEYFPLFSFIYKSGMHIYISESTKYLTCPTGYGTYYISGDGITFHMNSPIPPTIGGNWSPYRKWFEGATLYVPKGAKTAYQNSGWSNTTIIEMNPVKSVKLNAHSIILKKEEQSKLYATIIPEDADNQKIEWSSSDSQIVSVDENGNVTAIKGGEVWVKVVSHDNVLARDSCKVKVTQPVTGIQLSSESYQLADIGQGIQLEAKVLPEDATNKQVKWRSISENVCTVSQSGYVMAVGFGSTTIIATTEDGGFSATCSITVMKPSYTITYMVDGVPYKSYEIKVGEGITPEAEPAKEGYTFSGWSEIPSTMPAHDVTITGSFSVNSYTLIYMVDGKEYKRSSVKYGTALTPEVAPTREGYTFSGWSEIPATMPAKDVTVTGSFTINSYTLTYCVDGKEYKTSTVEYGTALTPEAEPAKEGYTFSGWSEIPETMPNYDVTVIGSFIVNSYTLTYLIDGETYKTSNVEFGSVLTAEENPVKEGYTFSGWSGLPATMPAKDVTVTGSFTINSYTLTYWVDGNEYKTSTVGYGTALTLEAEPTKEGYTFSGWSEIPSTMPAHDVMVTGSFSVNSYTIIYMVDGKEYKRSSVKYGTALTPEATPTREGYTFSGWSEIPATMPAKDVTVTGTFTINSYKLTYMVDGVVYKSFIIKYDEVISLETEPQKEGFSFSGWSEVPTTMPAHDVMVTGSFVINQYSITYLYEGEVFQAVTLDYQAEVVAPAFPLVVEGYTFVWEGLPERMPAHDVTVTGVFQVNQYCITYVVDGEVVDTQMVDYGSEITLPEMNDREGYTFGWDPYPQTMPARDLTITGSYLTGIRSLKGELAVQQIYTVDGKRVAKVGRGVHLVRQGKQIIKIVK